MSKLCNLIEIHQTGRVKVVPNNVPNVVAVKDGILQPGSMVAKSQYRLEVKLGVNVFADSDSGADMADLKDMCKRQILEEVFGEFRPLIRKVELAIYDLDFDAARTALRELELEMRY